MGDFLSSFTASVEAGGGKLILLESYRAAIDEGSKAFTISVDLDSAASALLLLGTGTVNAALDLELKVNGVTSGYRWDLIQQDTTTLSATQAAAQAEWQLGDATILDVANRIFTVIAWIKFVGVSNTFILNSTLGAPNEGQAIVDGDVPTSGSTATEVLVETSTSTWDAGTQFDLYRIGL